MKVYEEQQAEAIRTNAMIIVRGSGPNFRVDNVEADSVIADGFRSKAEAYAYAQVIRGHQERAAKKRAKA